jgi:hypothetical protein
MQQGGKGAVDRRGDCGGEARGWYGEKGRERWWASRHAAGWVDDVSDDVAG